MEEKITRLGSIFQTGIVHIMEVPNEDICITIAKKIVDIYGSFTHTNLALIVIANYTRCVNGFLTNPSGVVYGRLYIDSVRDDKPFEVKIEGDTITIIK